MLSEEDIPDHWELKPIEKVVRKAKNGGTPRRSTDEYWGGEIPWLSSSEVRGKYTTDSPDEYITQKGLDESSAYLWPKGTVLVAMYGRGTIGRPAIAGIETTGNQAICGLIPDEGVVDNEYLYYWLENIRAFLANKGRGATASRQNLNRGLIIETKIPVPPLNEQRTIVDSIEKRLDTVDSLSRSVTQINGLTSEYENSLLAFLFAGKDDLSTGSVDKIPAEHDIPDHWELKKIEEIGEVITGGTPKTDIDEYWSGDIPWIRVSDLDGSKYINESEDKITEAGLSAGSCSLLSKGSIVLSTRATIGEVAITGTELATNQGFKSIEPNEGISPEFLYYYLISISDYIKSLGKGATYDEVNKTQVQNIVIPVPPFDEQKEIVNRIEEVDMTRVNRAVKDVKELFHEYQDSVLYHSFTDSNNTQTKEGQLRLSEI